MPITVDDMYLAEWYTILRYASGATSMLWVDMAMVQGAERSATWFFTSTTTDCPYGGTNDLG